MRTIANRAKILYALIGVFVIAMGILFYMMFTNADTWATKKYNQHIYDSGTLVNGGSIFDCTGVTLAESKDGVRKFNDDKNIRIATLHTIGDLEGYISTGIHTTYKTELTGYSFVNGLFNTVQYGSGNSLTLTVNAELCATAYKALDGRKGTVGVYNYKTGEVLCVTSSPSYDTRNKPSNVDDDKTGKYEGLYINRFTNGVYTPGSIFKIVTAASAIENIPDIYSQKFTCTGKYETGNGTVVCNSVHGKIDFNDALSHSCNSAFAQIAEQLGNEKLQATAEKMGFNQSYSSKDGLLSYSQSKIDLSNANSLDLGWSGIGQYTNRVNPCQFLTVIGAIANGGTSPAPYIVSKMTTAAGTTEFSAKTQYLSEYLTAETASKLKEMLRNNVTDYYGEYRFKSLEMCGKTGTAEVSDDNSKNSHAWFAGYSQREDLPLAIIVVIENGGSGSGKAIPVANTVMQAALKYYGK